MYCMLACLSEHLLCGWKGSFLKTSEQDCAKVLEK